MKEKEKTNFSEKTSPMMFNLIASQYDKLNRVMTFGLDKAWRKAMLKLMPENINHWLDAATGTGDQIYFFLRKNFKAPFITGIDLSDGMLDIGKKKLKSFPHVTLTKASMTCIPLEEKSCCAVTCSFGIRNADPFEDALKEFHRVLKDQGSLIILESSRPKNALLRLGHKLYMKYMLPIYAKLLKSDPRAYTYLADTTAKFPCGEDFVSILKQIGFKDIKYLTKALGSVTIYYAKKA
jgi:demethylmenaquinone methyltransferase / 2-methoxy-6-polyprenyl-1,4-benzoquinol methylase